LKNLQVQSARGVCST